MTIKALSCNKATLDSGSRGCVCVIRKGGGGVSTENRHALVTCHAHHLQWTLVILNILLAANCILLHSIFDSPHAQLATVSHYITEEFPRCLAGNDFHEVGSNKLQPLCWKYVTISKESIHPNAQHVAKLQAPNFVPRLSCIKSGRSP